MKKKIKVLLDFTMLEQLHSGIGQLNYNYGKMLVEQNNLNFDFTFLVPIDKVGLFGDNVKYLTPNRWRKKFPILNKRYDIWHSTYQLSKYQPSPLTKHVILTIHDLNFLYEKDEKMAEKELIKLQKKVNRATIITCISNFVVQEIKQNLNTKGKDVKMIYNGVQDLTRKQGEIPDFVNERPFIFALGEIVEKKNFAVLLGLMQLLPQYDLYICGIKDRQYAKEILERIEQMRLSNTFLPGIITHENKIWLYRNCIAFTHPSKLEGFGLPVIEAMQFGKPVFVSNYTSLPEIASDYGFVWSSFISEEMKEVFDNGLKKNKEDQTAVRNMIQYALSFTFKRYVDQHLDLYNTCR